MKATIKIIINTRMVSDKEVLWEGKFIVRSIKRVVHTVRRTRSKDTESANKGSKAKGTRRLNLTRNSIILHLARIIIGSKLNGEERRVVIDIAIKVTKLEC